MPKKSYAGPAVDSKPIWGAVGVTWPTRFGAPGWAGSRSKDTRPAGRAPGGRLSDWHAGPARVPPTQEALMSTEIEFEQHVVIPQRSGPEVFDYVSEFSRAAEWRVEVTESTMSPPGPMRLGTRLGEVARVAGRKVVTESVVDQFAPPDSWTFAHIRGPLPCPAASGSSPATA